MHAKWKPTKKNLEAVIARVDPEQLYSRAEACEQLDIPGSAFDRYVRLNCIFLALGNTKKSGRFTFYLGRELIEQFERLKSGYAALELFNYYYHPVKESDTIKDKFFERYERKWDSVFAKGTYLELGGTKGTDW